MEKFLGIYLRKNVFCKLDLEGFKDPLKNFIPKSIEFGEGASIRVRGGA